MCEDSGGLGRNGWGEGVVETVGGGWVGETVVCVCVCVCVVGGVLSMAGDD